MAMILLIAFTGESPAAPARASAAPGVNQQIVGRNEQGATKKASFSPEQVEAIAAALPEGEARNNFLEGFAAAAETGGASSEDELRAGEGASQYFHKGVAAVSAAQDRIASFFKDTPGRGAEWRAAFENMNQGRGAGHLVLTVSAATLLILIGLLAEKMVKRYTRGLRRQILERARLGRLRFLGRIVSNLFLNLLGFGTYLVSTFLLCALIYKETDPGYLLVSVILLPSYYIRFLVMAADFGLSPSTPALRIFPMQDDDARFLYRWTVRLAVAGIGIASIAYLLKNTGISQDQFHLLYAMSGIAVNFLLIIMIWHSRRRVARAIRPADTESEAAQGSIREKFAKSWHFFAIVYVVVIGIYWFVNALAGRGAILELLVTLFLVPLFLGIDQWMQKLLKIASGELPEIIDFNEDAGNDIGALGAVEEREEIRHFAPLITRVFRVVLAICFFFAVLKLWGIDLPVGRIFTHTAFSIAAAVMFGYIGWQYVKTLIDRKLKDEMPDESVEMEEGGAGGSRTATLLMLLRKFALAVLIVMVALIVLSSIGINIGPLIAGAGVVGLAIGFGAQTLVKDIISGIFFLIDDAFRVGDYIETAGTKGMVEHISLRSLRLRHPRGPVYTIPFGGMGNVKNNSRDYIIEKLDFRVRYDTSVNKVRKIIKKINKKLQKDPELGPVLLDKVKSQGVRELDDSAMVMRVKFKTIPGEQFVVRREVFRLMQEAFRENGIEFAHRNVTVYLPPESSAEGREPDKGVREKTPGNKKAVESAGAAAALAAIQAEEEENSGAENKKPKS